MAKQLVTRYVDDVDGTDAVGPEYFMWRGIRYVIDLNSVHSDEMDRDMAKWVEHASVDDGTREDSPFYRRTASALPPAMRKVARAHQPNPTADKERQRAIRAWAAENGYKLADRGRIPLLVIEAYENRNRRRTTGRESTTSDGLPAVEEGMVASDKKRAAAPVTVSFRTGAAEG